jgi:hypothetical protein
MKQYTIDQLNDLLNRACEIITSLEGYAKEHSHYPEHNRELQKSIDAFFDEIDYMNEDEPEYDSAGFTAEDRIVEEQYMTYVENVKRNIDQATAEGILRDDWSEGYNYRSKEAWLRMQADQEAQDADLFGKHKI